MNAGISFSPLGQPGGATDPMQQQRPSGAPVQDAIRLLSLKMPTTAGPSAVSPLFGGSPTALGPQLGNVIADNWLQQQYGGRQKVMPVPAYQQSTDGSAGAIFSQLLQQMGIPSLASQPAPGGVQARVKEQNPLEDFLGGLAGAAPAAPDLGQLLENLRGRMGGNGGYSAGAPAFAMGGGGFNERTPGGSIAPLNGGFSGPEVPSY